MKVDPFFSKTACEAVGGLKDICQKINYSYHLLPYWIMVILIFYFYLLLHFFAFFFFFYFSSAPSFSYFLFLFFYTSSVFFSFFFFILSYPLVCLFLQLYNIDIVSIPPFSFCQPPPHSLHLHFILILNFHSVQHIETLSL